MKYRNKTWIIKRIIKLLDKINDEEIGDVANEVICFHYSDEQLLRLEEILKLHIKKVKLCEENQNI